MADPIFADGIRFEKRHQNAPEFIKGKVSFKVDQAIAFLQQHKNPAGYVNLDLKQSKSGVLYLQLNDWQKDRIKTEEGEVNPDDVPFS